MHHINIDLETYSSVDIGKAGLYKYVQAPTFQILLLAYSIDGGPVSVIDLAQGEAIAPWLLRALSDPAYCKHAFNAAFEWYCLNTLAPTPISQWQCTMVHGLYCGYPASLAAMGKALGLPEEKQKASTGKALIRTFCIPCKPSHSNGGRIRTLPHHELEKWELFKEYNRQDVVTEWEIGRRLAPFPVPDTVQKQWETDMEMNARGVAIDCDFVDGALYCSAKVKESLTAQTVALSGLENPNSVSQLTKWLEKETEEEITDLRKETVCDLLKKDLPSHAARRMLEIRQELGKASTSKYKAMEAGVCRDSRIRGLLQFYGTNRTGRWAGRLVQVQNLPRTYLEPIPPPARNLVKQRNVEGLWMVYGSVPDTLSQLIRTAFVPAPGCTFLDADFSAIEARVIAWLAGEAWVLEVFRTHGKIYEACASQMFGVPLEKIKKGNPEYELRQRGKVATLALGYQGNVGALTQMDLAHVLTEEEKPGIVKRWRLANPRIVDLWYAVGNAAIATVKTGRTTAVRNLLFALEGAENQVFLTIQLPSGRKLYYAYPSIGINDWGNPGLKYWGVNQSKKKWECIDTYGGKLVENITQAVARDCLAVNIQRLAGAGYHIVFHVHDEVIIEAPKERADLGEVCRIMSQPIDWAPGLPLKAEGWVGDYYRKE